MALADGDVDLLQPQGNALTVESVLQAQGGVPALPSAIDVVNKPGGQLNVLVSSEGSDNIFVFSQVAASEEGGGALPGGSSPPALNSIQTPTLSSATREPTFALDDKRDRDERLVDDGEHEYVDLDELGLRVIDGHLRQSGCRLGGFSSLGNRSTTGNDSTVLVPVEGNTYLSVPILDLGSGNDDEGGAGERRMPWLSGKYKFGDTSALTRFVIGPR